MAPELRFTSRVSAYVAGRPGYPASLPTRVRDHLGLTPATRVADIGSGTGLLSDVFVADGHAVVGVEPDPRMAQAAVQALTAGGLFTDQRGSAEHTGLPSASVDLWVVGQAFHWFDPAAARVEALRTLGDDPVAALVWNERPRHEDDPERTPFLAAYEALVCRFDLGTYHATSSRWSKAAPIAAFFGHPVPVSFAISHTHCVTLAGLVARASSCSYLPGPQHTDHPEMVAQLTRLFDAYAEGPTVPMPYRCQVFCDRLR